MAVNPINLGRISFNLRTTSIVDTLRRNSLDLFLRQQQLATGKRLNTISDDPLLANRAVNLQSLVEQQNKLLDGVHYAGNFLAATDDATSEISTLLLDAKELALANVGTLTSDEERRAAATVVQSIIDQLVAVGNRTYIDTFLFSGRDTTQPPFDRIGEGVSFSGDTRSLEARVDSFGTDTFSITGDDFFGALSSRIQGFVDLNPVLDAATRLKDIHGTLGDGIRKGVIEITESGGVGVFQVDINSADTIGDVIDLINDAYTGAGGVGTLAALNGTSDGLDLTSGAGNIGVRDLNGGLTTIDLGIQSYPPASNTITGADINARLTLRSPLSGLLGGAGLTLADPIVITNGQRSVTVDLSTANDIEDILNAINYSGIGVRAEINEAETGINIVNEISGAVMTIGEVGGGNTAEALGIRSLHGGTLLSELNYGKGVDIVPGETDLVVTARDGTTYDVNLDGSITVQDVVDAINAATGGAVTASLAQDGNGIRLVDTTGSTATQLRVSRPLDSPSFAADDLGLNQSVTGNELISDDVNGVRADGVFTILIDLQRALNTSDTQGITDAGDRLDGLIRQVNEQRGMVGAQSAAMKARQFQLEDALLVTQTTLSEVEDLDYTEAVTRFAQTQTAFEANLQASSQLLTLSLLDFLR